MVLRFLIHRATIPFDTCSRLRRPVLFVADSGAFLLPKHHHLSTGNKKPLTSNA